MADPNIEATPEAHEIDRSDLDQLSERERQETEEILADVAGGGPPKAPGDKEEETPEGGDAPEKKPEEEGKPKPEETPESKAGEEGKDKTPPQARREPAQVPAWQLRIAEKREAKATEELESARAAGEAAAHAGAKPEEVAKIVTEKVAATAEKLGLDPEALSEFAQTIVEAVRGGNTALPEGMQEMLTEVARLKTEREVAVEEANFARDFDQFVLPLIKAEYGDDVPAEAVAKIKDELVKVAYTPEYAKVPYSVIYRGQEEFRSLVNPKVKGAEPNRGGTVVLSQERAPAEAGAVDWGKLESDTSFELSDEDQRKLSDADFDKYCDIMAKRDTAARVARNAERSR